MDRTIRPALRTAFLTLALCAEARAAAPAAATNPAPAAPIVAPALPPVLPPGAGAPAPAFAAERLEGGTLTLASLRGKVVLLNFWGISCPPCRVEMPELEAIHRRHAARGLVVLGIAEMNPTREQARRFVEEIGATYPIVLDPGERLGALYGLEAHPTTFVIDARGVVTFVNAGYLRGEEKEIEAAVVAALAAARAQGRG